MTKHRDYNLGNVGRMAQCIPTNANQANLQKPHMPRLNAKPGGYTAMSLLRLSGIPMYAVLTFEKRRYSLIYFGNTLTKNDREIESDDFATIHAHWNC